ncbi:MAG: LamG-like jellyroll fold domain-containing protein, partial [Planctomycetota bacterium]
MLKLKCMMCVSVITSLAAVCAGIPANPAEDPHVMIWYKLDETEGGTAHDGSMYGRDAVVDGPGNLGVWNPDDGQFGGSLIFNDNTDIEVPTDALSTISTGIAVSVWLKDASRPGSNNWVFGTGSGSFRVTAAVVASNGSVLWQAGNSSNDQLSWDLDGLDHTTLKGWHHWVFVKDEVSGTISIYFDGSLAASKSGVDNTLANVPGSQLRFGVGAGHANDFIGMMDDIRVYDLALTAGEVQLLYTGVFDVAVDPDPADKAEDIPRDNVILSWMPGATADKHDIYFGGNFNDVDNATRGDPVFQGTQTQNAYALDRLEFGYTYYWRIDEVNDLEPGSPSKGEVWSFTTEPLGYPISGTNISATASSTGQADFGPEKTIDGSGLNENDLHSAEPTDMWLTGNEPQGAWIQYELDKVYKLHQMWVWNSNQVLEVFLGYGLKDVTVEYSTDGAVWTTVTGVPPFAQAPGAAGYAHNTTVDFSGVVAKYVKLTATSNWGGVLPQFSLSEVRFFYVPVSAREPSPDSGATDVDVEVILVWRAGREAATHEVYVSTDEQAVVVGTTPAVSVTDASYSSAFDLGSTYFWRIDEVNDAETPAVWQGDVWSFSTLEYLVVEDFEDYNKYAPNEIWNKWLDGYEIPGNGATAGYPDSVVQAGGDYMERTIVHGGKQSMPLFYDNTGTASYSEVERTFSVAQDWTAHGAETLMLYFRGRPFAFLQRADGSILMSGAGVDIGEMADEFRFAYRQLNGNGSIVARVDSLANTHAWAKAGVMIRESLDIGSRSAALYITPGNGCRFQVRTATPANAIGDDAVATPEQIAISAPHWIQLERSGDV